MTVVQNEATLSKNAGLGQAHPQKQLAVKVLRRTEVRMLICTIGKKRIEKIRTEAIRGRNRCGMNR